MFNYYQAKVRSNKFTFEQAIILHRIVIKKITNRRRTIFRANSIKTIILLRFIQIILACTNMHEWLKIFKIFELNQ